MTIDNEDLAILGPGYALYFEFKKQLLIAVAILGLIIGVVTLYPVIRAYLKYKDNEIYETWPTVTAGSMSTTLFY